MLSILVVLFQNCEGYQSVGLEISSEGNEIPDVTDPVLEEEPIQPEVPTACSSEVAVPCTSSQSTCAERIQLESATLEVWRSFALQTDNCRIRHAVIMIHGRSRNPDSYFSYATAAARLSNRLSDTLVISPSFREQSDEKEPTDLFWQRVSGSQAQTDWAMGGESAGPIAVSSYDVLDRLIHSIGTSKHFPNLQTIVVAGHSAGGQVVQRYALTGNYNNLGLTQEISYVVANPSSYAYLDSRRPRSGSTTVFEFPSGCSSWNRWGYGFERPNSYASRYPAETLIARYLQRKVTYLLGESDTGSASLDVTCSANVQGRNRFERGTAYYNFIQSFYQASNHSRIVVPGVAHSGSQMYQSAQGRSTLFP